MCRKIDDIGNHLAGIGHECHFPAMHPDSDCHTLIYRIAGMSIDEWHNPLNLDSEPSSPDSVMLERESQDSTVTGPGPDSSVICRQSLTEGRPEEGVELLHRFSAELLHQFRAADDVHAGDGDIIVPAAFQRAPIRTLTQVFLESDDFTFLQIVDEPGFRQLQKKILQAFYTDFLTKNDFLIHFHQELDVVAQLFAFGQVLNENLSGHSRRQSEVTTLAAQIMYIQIGNEHLAQSFNLVRYKTPADGLNQQVFHGGV